VTSIASDSNGAVDSWDCAIVWRVILIVFDLYGGSRDSVVDDLPNLGPHDLWYDHVIASDVVFLVNVSGNAISD